MMPNSIPSMEDSPAAGSSIPSMEDSAAPASAPPSMRDKAIGVVKSNAKNLLSIADMVGSIPAGVVGVAADAGVRVKAGLQGETRRTSGVLGNMAFAEAMNTYGSPFSKLLRLAGMGTGEGDAPSGIDSLMGKATTLLNKGGEWVEQHTKGEISKEDVSTLVNEAMSLGGAKGLKVGVTTLAKRASTATLEGLKTIPEAERAGAYKAAQDAKDPAAPRDMAEQGTGAAVEAAAAKTKIADPKTLTFNPVNGELKEAIPDMGKELPKPTALETGLDKAAGGRRFDMTAEERIALKGLEDKPLDNPIIDEQGNVLRKGGRFDREGGAVDAKLMARLAAVGLGAWAGAYFDDEDHLHGALLGGLGGLAAGSLPYGKVVEGFKTTLGKDTRIRIDDIQDAHEEFTQLAGAETWAKQRSMEKLAPKKVDREAIFRAVQSDTVNTLPANLQSAAKIFSDHVASVGQHAQMEGVIHNLRDNYATNLYDWSANKSLFSSWMDRQSSGQGMSANTRFNKQRVYDTMADAKAAGLTPLTEDASAVMGIYANSVNRAIANKLLVQELKKATTPVVGPSGPVRPLPLVTDADKAPYYYVSVNNPSLMGVKVHPDIAPSLKLMYETSSPGMAMKIFSGISDIVKRNAVSLSAFHVKALVDAHIGAKPWKAGDLARGAVGAAVGGAVAGPIGAGYGFAAGMVSKDMISFARGTNHFLNELDKGANSKLVQDAAKGGLKYSPQDPVGVVEDSGMSYYKAMTAIGDAMGKIVPHGEMPVKGLIAVNKEMDRALWGIVHAGMKLTTFAESKSQLLINSARKALRDPSKALTEEQASKIAASFANDIYGGLNWRRIVEGVQSRFGREIAQGLLTPGGRRAMQILAFAPDWTVSTTRSMVKAFSGRPDFIRPSTLAGLHQQYVLRAAVYFYVTGNAINYAMSGHFMWDNKDKTMIELDPKGTRTMQWSKHFTEPLHWGINPAQQAINKLGVVPKEGAEQLLNVDYLSAKGRMPPMKDHLGHLAKNINPIAFQGGTGEAMVSSALGIPIYDKTARAAENKKLRDAEKEKKRRERK